MDIKDMKIYLSENVERVEKLLSYYGFHGFSYAYNNVRCAVPGGDNLTSVSIYMNEYLNGVVYTRGGFKGDIFTIVAHVTGKASKDIFGITRLLFNLPGYKSDGIRRINIIGDLGKYNKKPIVKESNTLYEENILNKYVRLPHEELILEGISPTVAESFNISYDPERDRILFPHYDWVELTKIVGLQGRIAGMTSEEASLLGVPKYWNYLKGYRKSNNLYGWHKAQEHVKEQSKLILFEGEKSVLRHFTFRRGEGCAVALGGHELSNQQVEFITQHTPFNCEIIVALDKDIMVNEKALILDMCKRLSKYRKTSYIFDEFDNGKVLKGKDAPVDNGYRVWEVLFERRIRFYNHL